MANVYLEMTDEGISYETFQLMTTEYQDVPILVEGELLGE